MRTRSVIMITNAFGDKGSHEHDICGWQRQHRPSKRARVEENITYQMAKKRNAESLLEWVDATSDIKDLRKGNDSAEKWAKIFARAADISGPEMMGEISVVSYEVLRKCRMKLDFVANIYHRRWFDAMLGQQETKVHLYLMCDASPQWRGLELWAASIDVLRSGADSADVRKLLLLPLITLPKSMRDQFGKCAAFVWQAFLVAGPSFDGVRRWLNSIRGVLTDLGTERLMARSPDFLISFFQWIGAPTPAGCQPQRYLLPKAIQVPGWKHILDNLIKNGLNSCKFFPKCIKMIRALVAFWRDVENKSEFSKFLKRKGMPGLAILIIETNLQTFAAWRWHKLEAIARDLLKWFASARLHFDRMLFSNKRDQKELTLVAQAFASDVFLDELIFVCWFCQWLGGIMRLVAQCPCHGVDLIDCPMRGRMLPVLHEMSVKMLRDGLDVANGWNAAANFNGNVSLFQEAQGLVRSTFDLGLLKVGFLDKAPWLFARLDQPGVRDRCVQQHLDSLPNPHKVSIEFCDAGSKWSEDIVAIAPDGSNVSTPLQHEIDGIKNMYLDDSRPK